MLSLTSSQQTVLTTHARRISWGGNKHQAPVSDWLCLVTDAMEGISYVGVLVLTDLVDIVGWYYQYGCPEETSHPATDREAHRQH